MALLLAYLFSQTAFILNWLTLDGAVSAAVFGTIAYGLGDLTGAAVVLLFFISGSLLSKDLITSEGFLEKKFRRNGIQVWSNGFWFSFWIIIWHLSGYDGFLTGAVASMAMATADTWASELGGTRLKAKARLITTGKRVEPGTDGAISVAGSLAAVFGSLLITLAYWYFRPEEPASTYIILASTGIVGCFLDSWIGARFQYKSYEVSFLQWFGQEKLNVDNNFVNWAGAGLASVLSIVLTLII